MVYGAFIFDKINKELSIQSMKHYLSETSQVLEEVSSSPDGLSAAEAASRLEKNGRNKLAEAKKTSVFKRFLQQLVNPMIIVLLVAAAVNLVTVIVERARGGEESFAEFSTPSSESFRREKRNRR